MSPLLHDWVMSTKISLANAWFPALDQRPFGFKGV